MKTMNLHPHPFQMSIRLLLKQDKHNPVTTSIKHPLRIQKTTGGSKLTAAHKVTDGAFCERKALEFEESNDPPRFPLPGWSVHW